MTALSPESQARGRESRHPSRMAQGLKKLPIFREPGGSNEPGLFGRLWRRLAPSTRMKRVAYAGLILLALSLWIDALALAAFPLLAVAFGYYLYRFAGLLRDRLFWRVRNRILASFVFIGVVPVGVVAFIGLIVVWFLVGAMGTLFTEREFGSTVDRLDHIALRVQLELYRAALNGDLSPVQTVTERMQANQDFSHLSISIFEQKGDTTALTYSSDPAPTVRGLPGWAAKGRFAGIAIDDSTAYFRAITDVYAGDRRFYVLASIPMSQEYEYAFWRKSGVYLYPYIPEGFHHDRRGVRIEHLHILKDPLTALDLIGSQEARRADPSLNIGALLLPWASLFRVAHWSSGPSAPSSNPLVIRMSIDPIRIFRHSMSGGFDLADPLLTALIALCAILALVELSSFAIGAVISRRITSAVHDLSQGTQAIRAGRLDFRAPARHHDQLGELVNSFNAMAASIQALLVEVGDKQRMEAELQMARDVQAQFFPKQIPRIGRLALSGACAPARVVSGDCYDFLLHAEALIDIVVSDISGKGLSAALLNASLQSALRLQVTVGALEAQPGRLASMVCHLNRHLCLNTAPERFATLFIGTYDPETSTLSYCCAGHNPPYLLQKGRLSQLCAGGVPLGLIADARYEEATVSLDAGDLFAIYTDGITEAQSLSGEMFGEERLERVILGCAGMSCEEIQSQILEAVRDFSLGVEQADDQTLVVGKIV